MESVTGDEGRRRLLDIGCGDGSFMLAAREAGWEVVGTELEPEEARRSGLTVETGLDRVADSGPFRCVTMWHSLEHMPDPVGVLRRVAGLLQRDGVLLVAVPDAGSDQARVFGRHWFHLDVPRHLVHFEAATLERCLQRAGLSIVRRWRGEVEYDAIGWIQSVLNAILPQPNVLFDLLTGRHPEASTAVGAASLVLGGVLGPCALPALALATLRERRGTLVIAARRLDAPASASRRGSAL